MYEDIVLDDNIALRNDIEYFFNHDDWAVAAIPNPRDDDPRRYAILAVLPEFLVIAFNRLIEKGLPRGAPAILTDEMLKELQAKPKVLETVPPWTLEVPRLEEILFIPNKNNETPGEDWRSSQFLAKNIYCVQPHILFV
jgi:hypothetical protein